MKSKLTCSQVSALLSYYINDKLDDDLKQFISYHLGKCPICRAKYDALKDMLMSLEQIKENLASFNPIKVLADKGEREMNLKISSYIDNELSDEENLRVKRNIISNPQAREKFENINTIRQMLQRDFEKTKNEAKFDYTRTIMSQLNLK